MWHGHFNMYNGTQLQPTTKNLSLSGEMEKDRFKSWLTRFHFGLVWCFSIFIDTIHKTNIIIGEFIKSLSPSHQLKRCRKSEKKKLKKENSFWKIDETHRIFLYRMTRFYTCASVLIIEFSFIITFKLTL